MQRNASIRCREPIPALAGIGLRSPHHDRVLSERPDVAWLEVHSENFFASGGTALTTLDRIREHYPLSLHGVGLSLGSTDPIDRLHLGKLRDVILRYEPALVSEHLSWSAIGGLHTNDLLPLPYTAEALELVSDRIDATQNYLGCRILIENISSYFAYRGCEMSESAFFTELVRRTGCGILLDVNNLYVNERNQGHPALAFIEEIPPDSVGEIHVAGHSIQEYDGYRIVVDTHDNAVCQAVWKLYEAAVTRIGRAPTLIEWDSNIPGLETLIAEAASANRIMERIDALAA